MTDETSISRIIGPNFFLGDLREELDLLTASPKTTAAARRELERVIRDALAIVPQRWPSEPMGKAALLLWIMANRPAVEGTRFRHKHEKFYGAGEKEKPSTLNLRRGGY